MMHDARDRNQGIWIEPSDRLYCAAYSSAASLVVRFSGYFRRASGEVAEYAVDINPTADRAVTASDVFFGSGFLLSCVASLASGNASRGQCYARAQIQRGTGTAAVKLHMVVGGYVSDEYGPSFPYGRVEGPLDGPGYTRIVTGTNPAVGVGIIETVPTGARWRITAISFTLITDATVADRLAGIFIYTGAGDIAVAISGQVQVASLSRYYHAGVGQQTTYAAISTTQILALTENRCPAGATIEVQCTGFVAGDNFDAVSIAAEEWIEA